MSGTVRLRTAAMMTAIASGLRPEEPDEVFTSVITNYLAAVAGRTNVCGRTWPI
jgi:hypothetical protein